MFVVVVFGIVVIDYQEVILFFDCQYWMVLDVVVVIDVLFFVGQEGVDEVWYRYIVKWCDYDQKGVVEQWDEGLVVQWMVFQYVDV